MTTYYVDFKNKTSQTWTMSVYQELPNSIGLDSVSWKQTTTPKGGESGVDWEVTYNVAIADYKQTGGIGVYKATQVLPAQLGTAWNVVFKEHIQQLEYVGASRNSQQIEIVNKSNLLANPGIGMSGEGSVFKNNVLNGANAQFVVTPTYYVGLFNQLQLGEVISSNVAVGPFMLKFPDGVNKATLTAKVEGASINVDIAYSIFGTASLEQVQKRIALLSAS